MRFWCVWVAISAAAWAQTPAGEPAPVRFDVVSIRPSRPGAVVQDARMSFQAKRFEALNITVAELLSSLHGYYGRVEGGPKWVANDRYDFLAKTDGEIPAAERST